MAIHPSFPASPYEILNPDFRWFPADEALREYLEGTYPEFKDAILVIHTNNNGEISESDAKKSKDELEKLRKASNNIDSWESPYKVIVSVLMLKEGWDVRNVVTIVGLRAYAINASQKKVRFDFVFVDEEDFERYTPDSFVSLVKNFRKYKNA